MADILPTSINAGELRARWSAFAWRAENEAEARTVVGDATAILGAMDIVFGEVDR